MQEKVVIVGGGIGGLAAALALVRRGIDVEVYEQAPELRELGAGVQISANGTRVLHALGLKDALEQVQVLPAGKAIRLWNTGQTWKVFELGMESVERYGFPYITIHRGDLHDVLTRTLLQVKPDAIHLNRKCVGLTQTANYVELHFEAGQSVAAKLVIGADGLHSVIRESLFGAAKPQFCGITAWRGVVPIERVPPTIAGYRHQLDRSRWPCRTLSSACRDPPQCRRPARAQGLGGRGLECARHHRRCPGRFPRLARRSVGAVQYYRRAVQVGAGVTPDHGAMEQGALHAPWRRLPFDGAVPRPGRGDGNRGRFRPGALPRKVRKRSRHRLCAL